MTSNAIVNGSFCQENGNTPALRMATRALGRMKGTSERVSGSRPSKETFINAINVTFCAKPENQAGQSYKAGFLQGVSAHFCHSLSLRLCHKAVRISTCFVYFFVLHHLAICAHGRLLGDVRSG